jgi:hypothetical protein
MTSPVSNLGVAKRNIVRADHAAAGKQRLGSDHHGR